MVKNQVTTFIIDEVDIWLANPQVGMEVLFAVKAVNQMLVITHHGSLLESGPTRTLKGHATPMSVTQMVNLQQNGINFLLVHINYDDAVVLFAKRSARPA